MCDFDAQWRQNGGQSTRSRVGVPQHDVSCDTKFAPTTAAASSCGGRGIAHCAMLTGVATFHLEHASQSFLLLVIPRFFQRFSIVLTIHPFTSERCQQQAISRAPLSRCWRILQRRDRAARSPRNQREWPKRQLCSKQAPATPFLVRTLMARQTRTGAGRHMHRSTSNTGNISSFVLTGYSLCPIP